MTDCGSNRISPPPLVLIKSDLEMRSMAGTPPPKDAIDENACGADDRRASVLAAAKAVADCKD
jgi:hypothetical protein